MLRRAAEIQLAARLPGLAVGEKVSLARRSGAGVIALLRQDPSPRVIAALLDNSRLTEGLLAPVVHRAATPAAILELIAADRRWGVRYPLRLALARNPATPLATAWRLLARCARATSRRWPPTRGARAAAAPGASLAGGDGMNEPGRVRSI